MIRFILSALFVILFFILSIPLWGIYFIVGLFSQDAKEKIYFKTVQFAFKVLTWLSGAKLTIKGLENVPKDEPVVYIGNHQSFFDVIITYALCPGITGYLSKPDFEKVPFLSRWMKKNYCLFLTRNDPRADLKIILKAIDYIKAKKSMFVFPEGTRSKNGELLEFHEAPMKLATKTGCKVVPVAISGTRNLFERQQPFIKAAPVTVTYLPPIDIKTLENEDKKFPAAYCKKLLQETLH